MAEDDFFSQLGGGDSFNPYPLIAQTLIGLPQGSKPAFKKPWQNALFTGLSSALGGVAMAKGADFANKKDIEGSKKYINALESIGYDLPGGLEQGLTDSDAKIRQLSRTLITPVLESAQATRKEEKDFAQKLNLMQIEQGLKNVGLEKEYGLKGDLAKIEAKAKGVDNWFDKQSDAFKNTIYQGVGVKKQLENLASEFEEAFKEGKDSAFYYQPLKEISGTKAQQLKAKMNTIAPLAARALGQAGDLNEQEQQRVLESIRGNLTASPSDISILLRNLSGQIEGFTNSKLMAAKQVDQFGPDALLGNLSQNMGASSEGYQIATGRGNIETKTLPNGEQVKVRRLPDGKYMEVF